MKRFHVHMAVKDLAASVRFYSALFDAAPSIRREDYAKWMLEDPRVNFAISTRSQADGLDHLGIQVEDHAELAQMRSRFGHADAAVIDRSGQDCCYAKSDKHWVTDPQGIAWETFHTLATIPVFGEVRAAATGPQACCPRAAAVGNEACCAG